jgi:glycosyltransferase involved in cell wall biosynthesis
MAATNRVKTLAKSILAENYTVEYIGLRGADTNTCQKKMAAGSFEGIPYRYPGMIAVRSSNWWLRRLDDCLGVTCSILYVLFKKCTQHADLVILYSRNYNVVSFWTRFFHFLRIPVILEVCEWPLAIAHTKGITSSKAERYFHLAVPLVDGVLPISSYIKNEITLIAKQAGKTIPSFTIPILIDTAPHPIQYNHKKQEPYLLYSGAIAYMDIAFIVIDTLHELKKLGHIVPVKFTGKEDKPRFEALKRYANEQGVLSQVEFTGFIDESLLHELMNGALALLAPLPDNLQSRSRFSTKLGYYLVSGTPVITTAVGDVDIYLKDGINAFVTQKCSPADIAAKIKNIIEAPESAQKIGVQGRKLALEKFHYSQACKGLGDFFHSILTRYH